VEVSLAPCVWAIASPFEEILRLLGPLR
jgi:hypothetical protein